MNTKYLAPKKVLIPRIITALLAIIVLATAVVALFFSVTIDEETSVIEITDQELLLVILGAIVVFIATIIVLILIYRRFKYYDDGENIVIQKGLIFKKTTSIPYYNINVISLRRNFLEIILGLTRVKIDTGTTASILAEAAIPTTKKYGVCLKAFLEAKKSNPSLVLPSPLDFTEEQVVDSENFYETKPTKLLAMGLTRTGVLSFIITVLIVFPITIYYAANSSPDLTNEPPVSLVVTAGLAILITIFLLAISVGQMVYLFGFKLKIDDKSIEYQYGLFTSTQYKFNRNKINALRIKQPLLYRLLGRYDVEISVIGIEAMDQEQNSNKTQNRNILPFAKLADVKRLLVVLNQEHLLENILVKPKKFKLTNFVLVPAFGLSLVFAAAIAFAVIYVPSYWAAVAGLVAAYLFLLIGLILRMVNHGYALSQNHIVVHSGAFTIVKSSIKKSRVQTVRYNQNPLQIIQRLGNVRLDYKDVYRNARILHQDVSHFETVEKQI